MRFATFEVEADNAQEARRLAFAEFEEMVGLAGGARPRPVERDIKIERVSIARKPELGIERRKLGPGVMCLHLSGALETRSFGRLQEELDALKALEVSRLVLDLSGIWYINSTGLSLMVAAGDLFDVRLAAVPDRINRIFRMIGLDKLFPTFRSAAEAAQAPPAAPAAS